MLSYSPYNGRRRSDPVETHVVGEGVVVYIFPSLPPDLLFYFGGGEFSKVSFVGFFLQVSEATTHCSFFLFICFNRTNIENGEYLMQKKRLLENE